MDYTGIIKRAWNVVWRHKILWLFGLFAGAGGGGGGGNSNVNLGSGDSAGMERLTGRFEDLGQWALANLALIAVLVAVIVFVGLVWWILSVAARGGLVHLVDEAEEGRPVRGGDGWRVGFHYWWRTLGLSLVLILPVAALILLLVGILVAALMPLGSDSPGAAAGGLVLGACCFGGLFVVLLILVILLVSVLIELGLRFIVLQDRGVFDAIGESISALRARFKDVAVMWLLLLAIGIGFGIVVAMIGVALALPAVFMLLAGNLAGAIMVFAALFLVLLLPGAIYAAFRSAIWTEFFRDFTGRGAIPAVSPAGAYPTPPPPPTGEYLPSPPVPPRPPAAPSPGAPPEEPRGEE